MFSTFRAVMLSDNRNSNCLNCKLSHECEWLPLQFLHNLEFNSEKRKKPEVEVLNPSVLWRNLFCYRKCIQHVKNCNTTAKKFKFGIIISISSKAVKQNINQKSTASHGIFSCRTFVSLLSHSNTLINFVMQRNVKPDGNASAQVHTNAHTGRRTGQNHDASCSILHTTTIYTHFNGLFSRTTYKSKNSLDLNEARRWWGFGMAVASAGPHANTLYLTPDR